MRAAETRERETTDMSEFDAAFRAKWCHIQDRYSDHNLCGTPKSLRPTTPPHRSIPGPVCEGCGHRTCPDCLRIRYEKWGRP